MANDLPQISSYIPPEIILKILLRLPSKSLLRFLSVCKAWNATIHDKTFIKAHYDLMKTDSPPTLVLVPRNPVKKPGVSPVSISFDGDELGNAVRIPMPLENSKTEIIGCCNGLFCITYYDEVSIEDEFAVWNPLVQRLKRIPLTATMPPAKPTPLKFTIRKHGFGYDSTNDDYKFVRVVISPGSLNSEVKIYSLKSNSWKEIQNWPCVKHSGLPTINNLHFANGSLHWLMDHKLIVTLDLATEKYDLLSTPELADAIFTTTLEVLGGSLCALYVNKEGYLNDVWIMKEYGVTASWTRLYTIDTRDMPVTLADRYSCWKPLVISKTGKMILLLSISDHCICWYDLEKKNAKTVDIRGMPPKYFTAAICVENLYLLHGT